MNTYEEYTQYLIDQISIEDVVKKLGRTVTVSGNARRCICFFHKEKNPSMYLYHESHQYHCYSCHAHGNIFTLVENQVNVDFAGAVKWLEDEFPYVKSERPENIKKSEVSEEKILDAYPLAYDCYEAMEEEEYNKFLEFSKERGMDAVSLESAEVFYAKGERLINVYADKINALKILEASGLIRQNVNGYYEYFRQRIILTLRDYSGKIVGYAGRAADEKTKPKYLFTPHLPKGSFLYHLNTINKDHDKKSVREIFLVEGPFDAIRLQTLGKDAVAVLGACLTQSQAGVLAKFIRDSGGNWKINVFMDSDHAGIVGTKQTIHALCLNLTTRQCIINVVVNHKRLAAFERSEDFSVDESKDPDEIFKNETNSINEFLEKNTLSLFEFLLRYEIDSDTLGVTKPLTKIYENYSLDQRIVLLNNAYSFLSPDIMGEMLKKYRTLFAVNRENAIVKDHIFAIWVLSGYDSGKGEDIFDHGMRPYASDSEAVMQNAIYVAQSSYRKQEPPLDDYTWERILLCADIFNPYLLKMIGGRSHQMEPRLSYYVPKRVGEYRLKSLYAHETLIMQQYMLNELLRRDENIAFEQSVLAVRYYPNQKQALYTTGKNYYEFYNKTEERLVSFAYQIDMSSINREGGSDLPMFRSYQDCWKSFIQYIQDGLDKFSGDTYYLVRLDIEKFYDCIPEYGVRNCLNECLDGLKNASNRFNIFEVGGEEEKKQKIVQWFLDELFGGSYFSPEDGEKKEDRPLTGIPQGPNLSAYIANIILFQMDYEVMEYVRRVNSKCVDNGKIHVRYARYVDDMVIVADDPEYIHDLEMIISSELYDLNLNLSSKTEESKKFTKEEAIEWTVDKRGGLGVSYVVDDEEPMDMGLDDYENMDAFDRKDGLELFKTLGASLDYFVKSDGDSMDSAIDTVFRMEDVRYTDIIWFAKILLRYIIKRGNATQDIWSAYLHEWHNGQRDNHKETLFFMEGIEFVSFICSVREILQQFAKNQSVYGWSQDEIELLKERIGACKCYILLDEYKTCEIVAKNYMIILIYVCNIIFLLYRENKINDDKTGCKLLNKYNHIYATRWRYMLNLNEEKECHLVSDATTYYANGILEAFHFSVHRLLKLNNSASDYLAQYKSIGMEVISAYGKPVNIGNNSEILNCLKVWFDENTQTNAVPNVKKFVFMLFQLLRKSILVEIVADKKVLRESIFEDDFQQYQFLPVVQGIQYPGILALEDSTKEEKMLQRADFMKDAEMCEQEDWIVQPDNPLKIAKSQAILKIQGLETLEQYLSYEPKQAQSDDTIYWMERIIEVYELLVEKLKETQIDNYLVVPSHRHVFIYKKQDKTKIKIITYKTECSKSGASVAVKARGQRMIPTPVQACGKEFWQAGRILEDVLNLNEKRLQAQNVKNEEVIAHIEFLEYIFRRLSGKSVNNSQVKLNNSKSFAASVKRMLELAHEYIEGKGSRKLYMFECKVLDSFISEKIRSKKSVFKNGDLLLFVTTWARKFLAGHGEEISDLISSIDSDKIVDGNVLRRMPEAFARVAFSLREWEKREMGGECPDKLKGIQILIKSLLALAITSTIRQQVLELIFTLDERTRKNFKPSSQLVLSLLDLDRMDEIVVYDRGQNSLESLQRICENLLEQKPDKTLRNITPIGWWLMLAWLMEENLQNKVMWDKMFRDGWQKGEGRENSLLNNDCTTPDENAQYPFEQCGEFFNFWNLDNYINWRNTLEQIDEVCGLKVCKVKSEVFKFATQGGKIKLYSIACLKVIGVEEEYSKDLEVDTQKPNYFLSYFKFDNRNISVEKQGEEFLFTETLYGKSVVGVSAVEDSVAQLWQNPRNREGEAQKEDLHETKTGNSYKMKQTEPSEILTSDASEGAVKGEAGADEHSGDGELVEPRLLENQDDKDINHLPSVSCIGGESHDVLLRNLDETLRIIQNNQRETWENRAQFKDNLKNTDRIALFQFSIDSSYFLPEEELCSLKKNKKKNLSCAEYRRRILINEAFKICGYNKVDILLLPEYSVRPDTVKWMKEELKREQKYKFSVWAGTFRIFPGYNIEEFGDLEDDKRGDKKNLYYSAVLPIICNKSDSPYGKNEKAKNIQTIMRRFKRYPAVNLKEIINPGFLEEAMFKPTIKKYYNDFLFADARDDVTELICAELFMITSPSNANTFCERANELHNMFSANKGSLGNMYQRMQEDIKAFGDATSFNQRECKYGRTAIVLVPACTTRAVDYYLNAQANYLAAGLTTVFCNSVCEESYGGSCFIGQNSWDDNKFIESHKKAPGSIIYHGCEPGIFQQSKSDDRSHGALGKKEQALVICDINPETMKGSPNPESMVDQLCLVAHIPFIEVDVTKHRDDEVEGTCRCQKDGDISIKLREVYEKCSPCDVDCSKFGRLCRDLKWLNDYLINITDRTKPILSSPDDVYGDDVSRMLNDLGQLCQSPGLRERGNIYKLKHVEVPYSCPPPAVLDFTVVKIDYQEMDEMAKIIAPRNNQPGQP